MSVPVNKRKQGKLEVCIKALNLATYTIMICCNKKIFGEQYQTALTDKIVNTAINIHCDVWAANNVLVKSPLDLQNRTQLQERAAVSCNLLLSLIDIAKPVFHLATKRIIFWGDHTVEVRNMIRAWRESDLERYAKFRV